MKLRVEYVWDEEGQGWGFTVPALGIVGSAKTRAEAEREAADVVKFVLEGVPQDFNDDPDVEVGHLNVDISPPEAVANKAS